MNFLLDSCGLLALAGGTLSDKARRALARADEACVSVISPWELALKVRAGKLSLPQPVHDWLLALAARHRLRVLPLTLEVTCAAAALPLLHRDPFDRVLIATAQRDRLTLLTSDRTLPTYPGITTLW